MQKEAIFVSAEAIFGKFDVSTYHQHRTKAKRSLLFNWVLWTLLLLFFFGFWLMWFFEKSVNKEPYIHFAWLTPTLNTSVEVSIPRVVNLSNPIIQPTLLIPKKQIPKSDLDKIQMTTPSSPQQGLVSQMPNLKSVVTPLVQQPLEPTPRKEGVIATPTKNESLPSKIVNSNKPKDFARANEYGLKMLLQDGVIRSNGAKIEVGEVFPNGEKILSVNPELGIIETDRRILNVID